MIRILFFILLVFALGSGFAWLANRPGEMVVTMGGYRYEVTLMVAASLLVAVVASVMLLWWIVKGIWNSPHLVARYFRVRRRDRGYQALSTGLIAAGAGDAELARRKKKEAMKLISSDQEPLIHLLDAQASILEGDHDAARRKFEGMLDDPEMRLIGLRGLYLEAERLGEREAARHYAERAAEMAPQLGWASEATLETRVADGDWDGAMRLLDARKATHQVDKGVAERQKAVLLTAKAGSLIDVDPSSAKAAAIEANRLSPDLVPAAVMAARALFKQGDLRKGSKILEAAWRKEAHPDIADAYVHARHGDSVLDRLARARKLQSQKQNNAEAALTVARAALEAGDYRLARESAEAAIRIQPREGAYLLLADIEEAETGDQGRIRHWLSKAVRAPQDPVWVADGHVSERWLPFSPVTGRIDAFEWRPPVERPGRLIEQAFDDAPAPAPQPPQLAPAAGSPSMVADETVEAEIIAAEPVRSEVIEHAQAPVTSPRQAATEEAPRQADDDQVTDKPAAAQAPVNGKAASQPIPDDPGVDPSETDDSRNQRFRLF